MKVIDLLNKIAKGEIIELHKFKWSERVWEEYSKFEEINNEKSYQEHRKNGTTFMRFESICDARHFNDEVEIIEEEKEIEEIGIDENGFIHTELGAWKGRIMDKAFANKINELIDIVKELKNEKGNNR